MNREHDLQGRDSATEKTQPHADNSAGAGDDARDDAPAEPPRAPAGASAPALSAPLTMRAGSRLGLALVGVIGVAAVSVAVLNADKIAAMAAHAANAEPGWLAIAVICQCAAFFCTALAWRLVLLKLREPISMTALYPLSIAKLFADQALPSGGLSGAAFLLHALKRRGVSWDHAYTAFIFGATTFIAAFLISAFVSFVAVAGAEDTPRIIAVAARAFYILLVVATLFLAGFALFRWPRVAAFLHNIPAAASLMDMSQNALRVIAREKALFAKVIWVQIIQRLCDALTLWLVFQAIDAPIAFVACFIGVTLASVTATVAPTPMGVGAFEGGLVAAMAVFGVPVETALMGALIYRGLSLWLPLIPGFFVIQREFLYGPKNAGTHQRPGASPE